MSRSTGGECSQNEIDAVVTAARSQAARVVVGAGGGKVLDTARAAASALDVPMVSCPTTASSDAPCSALSVVYTDDGGFDRYMFHRRNHEPFPLEPSMILDAIRAADSAGRAFRARTVDTD